MFILVCMYIYIYMISYPHDIPLNILPLEALASDAVSQELEVEARLV